jgi:hypothetical protein
MYILSVCVPPFVFSFGFGNLIVDCSVAGKEVGEGCDLLQSL